MSSRPFNPNVKLPRQIAAKVADGETAFNEAYPDPLRAAGGGEPGGGDTPPPSAPPPETEPPATVEVPPPEPVPPAAEPPPPGESEELAKLRKAHQSLQGKYNQELPRANARIVELTDMVTKLTGQVALLQARAAEPPAPPAPSLEEEYADKFDPELMQYVSAKIKPLTDQLTAAHNTIRQLEDQIGQVRKATAEQSQSTLKSMLDRDLPGWAAQNNDPEFGQWLESTLHPDTGVSYKMILDNAVQRKDTGKIGMVFRAYPGSVLAQPAPPTAPAPNPPRQETGQVTLDTLAAPPRGRRVSISSPQPQGIITADDLRRFDADVARGRYRNDPAGRKAIEDVIDKAIAENRFQPQQRH